MAALHRLHAAKRASTHAQCKPLADVAQETDDTASSKAIDSHGLSGRQLLCSSAGGRIKARTR